MEITPIGPRAALRQEPVEAMTKNHTHRHGNTNDQGPRAMLRYAKQARTMWRSPVNDEVVGRLAPQRNETVVDIGAGVGAGTITAAKTGATVIAIEPTLYMNRILAWRCKIQRAGGRVHVVEGTAETTGLEDESVDAGWAVNTMHHWTDPTEASLELARILRPGGRILLADEDFQDPSHPHFASFAQREEGHHHAFAMVDLDAIAELLRSADLKVSTAKKENLADAPTLVIEATKPHCQTGVRP